MTDTWVTTKTASLIEEGRLIIGDGYRAKNSEFVPDGGLPFVRVGDVGVRVRTEERDELPASKRASYEPKVSQPDDCMITMKGTVGRVARVLPETRPFVYSPQISFWRVVDKDLLDPGYLSFWLRSPSFSEQAFAAKSDTDMADYINLRDQRRMTIRLPRIEDQRRISAVLSALEGLIEVNQRQLAIRDLLLPRLVTGKLDISDVDLGGLEPTEPD